MAHLASNRVIGPGNHTWVTHYSCSKCGVIFTDPKLFSTTEIEVDVIDKDDVFDHDLGTTPRQMREDMNRQFEATRAANPQDEDEEISGVPAVDLPIPGVTPISVAQREFDEHRQGDSGSG